MSTKRSRSPDLVTNPFIKKRNLEWSIDITGLPYDAASSDSSDEDDHQNEQSLITSAAIEAGKASIEDHLDYFSALLTKATLSPFPSDTPHLSVKGYRDLYEANAGSPRGAHFIIHQHDHPIAGTHYDLRLQINETSSASWAIMYGPPGDPNSYRLNRNATETRIHCLWNHLIETASHATGSLLIWDTGTYNILPVAEQKSSRDYSQSSTDEDDSSPQPTEQEKLHQAFSARKIRLQLHGARLPSPYVLNLRLTREEDAAGRARSTRVPKTRRRRDAPGRLTRSRGKKVVEYATSSDSESDDDIVRAPATKVKDNEKNISATERELRELEDEEVRRTNAYPGAINSIGSVHQRHWYLSLDRKASGFVKRRREGRVVWKSTEGAAGVPQKVVRGRNEKNSNQDEATTSRLAYPFYVRGVEHERSVVTGRLGSEVLKDEGVIGYIGRKGWQAVLK
ncbi:DNA polymerase ligase-domain-containing protein [Xylaria curta]|nr:DNA polymerase ligase-domain-containing protein [Xylaria curta]